MDQDKLQVALDYDVKGVALAELEKNIDRSVQKTKVLERAARMTGSRLNKMMDDYKSRTQKSESATGKMIKSLGGMAVAAVSASASAGVKPSRIETRSRTESGIIRLATFPIWCAVARQCRAASKGGGRRP